MFEVILLVSVSIYFILSLFFLILSNRKFDKVNEAGLPSATVIVAARNEEDNIEDCLISLSRLEYPAGKLEIIIADDSSEDKTAEIIRDFIKDKPLFRYLRINENICGLKGKTNALAIAIREAGNEVILTTDADCRVPAKWAKSICSYYMDDVALVCGFTTQDSFGRFSGMQALDFIYLLTIASGTMNAGMPLSCIGNNMSFRKSIYLEAGGYEAIDFSVTEDFQLLKEIKKLKKYKAIYPIDEEALVISRPAGNFKGLFWQKKRWAVGGMDIDIKGFLVMASSYITNAAVILSPLFISASVLYLVVYKICIDFFFLYGMLTKLKISNKIKYFFSFELYYMLYVVVLPLAVLMSRKVVWKGREY